MPSHNSNASIEGKTNDKTIKPADVSFSLAQLSKHNNVKSGHWVAIDGIVYDITKIITDHPYLIPYTGTDITNIFPNLPDSLSTHVIGRLVEPPQANKIALKPLLYEITKIENLLDSVLSEKNTKLYESTYQETSKRIALLLSNFSGLLTETENQHLCESKENFAALNQQFEKTNKNTSDYAQLLFQYKGISNLIKFMLENYLTHRFVPDELESDLGLLATTEQEDVLNLIDHSSQCRNHGVTIIGGSICGIALAMQLKKLGLDVKVYDKLDDPRVKYSEHASASFNLFINERGLHALDSLGIKQKLLDIGFPIYGRAFHLIDGNIRDEVMGPNNEALISVRREDLLAMLITEAEKKGIKVQFGVECKSVKLNDNGSAIDAMDLYNNRPLQINTGRVFGADGSHSILRRELENNCSPEQKSVIEAHALTYREFMIPANAKGESRLDIRKSHIWPRKGFTLGAFPNEDQSFSLALFIDRSNPDLAQLQNDPHCLAEFFKQHFADLFPLLEQIILNEPSRRWGLLNKVDAKHWHVANRALLVGDAAHAFYPFNGQSANTALDDGLALVDLIKNEAETSKTSVNDESFNWDKVFCEFEKRKSETDIIAQYAKKVNVLDLTQEEFELQHRIELELTRQGVPSFFNAISFTSVPYDQARKISANHEPLLQEIFEKLKKQPNKPNDSQIEAEIRQAIAARSKENSPAVYYKAGNKSLMWEKSKQTQSGIDFDPEMNINQRIKSVA